MGRSLIFNKKIHFHMLRTALSKSRKEKKWEVILIG